MAYIFRTTNPAEASFVENFFVEKGFKCSLLPTGGLYGLQNYEVHVAADVDAKLEAELKKHLSDPPPPPKRKR